MHSSRVAWAAGLIATITVAAHAGPAVTVYNKDFAVVRTTQTFDIASGRSTLTFTDVAEHIDPTSVQFFCPADPSCRVVEQNFDFDLVSTAKLLQKMIDQPITLTTKDGTSHTGTLLSCEMSSSMHNIPPYMQAAIPQATTGRITLKDSKSGELKIFELSDNLRSITLPKRPEGLLLRPALVWQIARDKSGPVESQVAYQTTGLSWRADYNVLIHEDTKTLDVNAWVTVTNTSGATYKDCTLKVVAGDVNKVREDVDLNEGKMEKVRLYAAMPEPLSNAAIGFAERQLSEYHLYALGRLTTLADRQTKQIELFTAAAVPFKAVYEFSPSADDDRPRRFGGRRRPQSDLGSDAQPLQLVYIVNNKKENHLGMPLPAGTVRFYQTDAGGNDQFVGDTSIDHTPKDEELRLNIATTSDIIGQCVRSDFSQPSAGTMYQGTIITIRNHKNAAVSVSIVDKLIASSNWTIEENTHPFTKKDFQTIEFPITVPANGEVIVSYRTHYERYQW